MMAASKLPSIETSLLAAIDALPARITEVTANSREARAGYAAFDNFKVAAADQSGVIPEPGTWALLLGGLGAMGFAMQRSRTSVARRTPAGVGR